MRASVVRQRRDVEGLADALPALDLDQQHPLAAVGQRERQGGGDGRLAGAALAGDDVQAHPLPVAVAGSRRAGSHGASLSGQGAHRRRAPSRRPGATGRSRRSGRRPRAASAAPRASRCAARASAARRSGRPRAGTVRRRVPCSRTTGTAGASRAGSARAYAARSGPSGSPPIRLWAARSPSPRRAVRVRSTQPASETTPAQAVRLRLARDPRHELATGGVAHQHDPVGEGRVRAGPRRRRPRRPGRCRASRRRACRPGGTPAPRRGSRRRRTPAPAPRRGPGRSPSARSRRGRRRRWRRAGGPAGRRTSYTWAGSSP